MAAALTAAETGHLVFSTLHTLDAPETVNRIVGAFPPHQQGQIRQQLARVLKAEVSQRLLPRADGQGRALAAEVMLTAVKPRVRKIMEITKVNDFFLTFSTTWEAVEALANTGTA